MSKIGVLAPQELKTNPGSKGGERTRGKTCKEKEEERRGKRGIKEDSTYYLGSIRVVWVYVMKGINTNLV